MGNFKANKFRTILFHLLAVQNLRRFTIHCALGPNLTESQVLDDFTEGMERHAVLPTKDLRDVRWQERGRQPSGW